MNIRLLQRNDALLYLRLQSGGLQYDQEAFGSTYEEEMACSFETVLEWLQPDDESFVLGAFTDDGSLVGTVRFYQELHVKTRHKGVVSAFFVSPEARAQGIGRSIMEELIVRAKQNKDIEQILLRVPSENRTAKELFRRLGFIVYGTEPRAVKWLGRYDDEDLMVKYLY